MNFDLNYYSLLGVTREATLQEIKKSYYKLSFTQHPDKGGTIDKFSPIAEAYEILTDIEKRQEYDQKSRFGKNYDEFEELFIINTDFDYNKEKSKLEVFKKNEILNVFLKVDPDNFDGTVEYERWVICKKCKGSGRDMESKIEIRDENGNIKGIFDSTDGCDFCNGIGKDDRDEVCSFCNGEGKIGIKECKVCKGKRRILGKQKLSKVILEDKKETIVKLMGNFSAYNLGKVGDLILVNTKYLS